MYIQLKCWVTQVPSTPLALMPLLIEEFHFSLQQSCIWFSLHGRYHCSSCHVLFAMLFMLNVIGHPREDLKTTLSIRKGRNVLRKNEL